MTETLSVPQPTQPADDGGPALLGKRRGKARRDRHAGDAGAGSRDPLEIEDVDPRKVFSRGRYRSSQVSVLLVRFARIRGDLMTSLGENVDDQQRRHAELCRDHLRSAKAQLESPRGMLSVCANLLGLADRELVCLHRTELLCYRLRGVRDELADRKLASPAVLAQLEELAVPPDEDESGTTDVRRRALKDGLTILHAQEEQQLIEDDLQVTRLWRLVALAVVAWFALLAVVPVVTSAGGASGDNFIWPIWAPTGQEQWDLVIAAMGLSVVGAVGGIVSGMLTVRDSRAALSDYRTSMLKLTLKPLAGAVAAIILYLFLSAGVVSGVEVTNTGVYVVAGFLAGFSERYFLRVLRAQDDGEEPAPPSAKKAVAKPARAEEPAPAPVA